MSLYGGLRCGSLAQISNVDLKTIIRHKNRIQAYFRHEPVKQVLAELPWPPG
jgi:hypothetical protein